MTLSMFDGYRDKYENVKMRREDGILEVALHSNGGPLISQTPRSMATNACGSYSDRSTVLQGGDPEFLTP